MAFWLVIDMKNEFALRAKKEKGEQGARRKEGGRRSLTR